MTDTLNLLPCPFCGGVTSVESNTDGIKVVFCDTEDCCLQYYDPAPIEKWNKRAPITQGEISDDALKQNALNGIDMALRNLRSDAALSRDLLCDALRTAKNILLREPKREIVSPEEIRDLKECKWMFQRACECYLSVEQIKQISSDAVDIRNLIEGGE